MTCATSSHCRPHSASLLHLFTGFPPRSRRSFVTTSLLLPLEGTLRYMKMGGGCRCYDALFGVAIIFQVTTRSFKQSFIYSPPWSIAGRWWFSGCPPTRYRNRCSGAHPAAQMEQPTPSKSMQSLLQPATGLSLWTMSLIFATRHPVHR